MPKESDMPQEPAVPQNPVTDDGTGPLIHDDTGPLIFVQFYLDCLSHASYLIGDRTTGRAVVVDPQRDVNEYLATAAHHGLTIERVIETHVHADFLSGHLELAERTGAPISYSSAADVDFDTDPLADGQHLGLGEVDLQILHTPGHTPESVCVVVREHAADPIPYGVLTGDTLFIGDVGRPDLLSARGRSAEDMARALYRSTRERLLTLPDETRVFPAHGAGSACGKNLSTALSCTLGTQRRTNYALAAMSEDAFVEVVTSGQSAAPAYFSFTSERNREARPVLDEDAPVPALTPDAARRPSPTARPSSTPGHPTPSPPPTCPARSTSRWAAGSPNSAARCFRPGPTSSCAGTPARRARPATASPASDTTGSSAPSPPTP